MLLLWACVYMGGGAGSCSVEQASLKLLIPLPQPPTKGWDYKSESPHLMVPILKEFTAVRERARQIFTEMPQVVP